MIVATAGQNGGMTQPGNGNGGGVQTGEGGDGDQHVILAAGELAQLRERSPSAGSRLLGSRTFRWIATCGYWAPPLPWHGL